MHLRDDEIHQYQDPVTARSAQCRLRVYADGVTGRTVVIATECHAATSLTNAAALLATEMARREHAGAAEAFVWIEHYSHQALPGRLLPAHETFDRVTFTRGADGRLACPQWRRLAKGAVEALVGQALRD